VVRFLLSDQGRWINGQLIHSNGGFPKGPAGRLSSNATAAVVSGNRSMALS